MISSTVGGSGGYRSPLLRGGRARWYPGRVAGDRRRPAQSTSGADSMMSSFGRWLTTPSSRAVPMSRAGAARTPPRARFSREASVEPSWRRRVHSWPSTRATPAALTTPPTATRSPSPFGALATAFTGRAGAHGRPPLAAGDLGCRQRHGRRQLFCSQPKQRYMTRMSMLGSAPSAPGRLRSDLSATLWNVRRRTLGGRRPRFVAPASWLPFVGDVAFMRAGSVDERREVLACAGAASRDDLEQVAQ
jgi:hypothetical protein